MTSADTKPAVNLRPKSRNAGQRHSQTPPALLRTVLIGASSIALFYGLGERLLKTWDEAIYGEVAREMLVRHSWLTPSWNFQPWFEKPPLFMWLTALAYRCLGVSETSSRLVGVICGVATVCLTFEIGRRLLGDWSAFAAAVILLTNGYFVLVSRFEAINIPLALCFTLAAYGYIQALQGSPRAWYVVGAAMGAGIMLKGAAGLIAPISICLALLIDRRLNILRSPEPRNSALLAIAIAAPWHAWMLISHGRPFMQEYFGYHVLARISGIEVAPQPPYFYLLAYWHALVPFAVLALIGAVMHARGQGDTSAILSFALTVTVAFSLVGTKLMAYVVPAFPFISLLAMLGVRRVFVAKRLAIACLVLLLPLYWFSERNLIDLNYSPNLAYVGSLNSRGEPLMRLLLMARPKENDPLPPSPLIICVDGFQLQKQQSVFYGERPVTRAFLHPLPEEGDSHSPRQTRYEGRVPLDQVVTANPTLIIIPDEMYPELTRSGEYNFSAVAESYPLMLGRISRP